MKWGFNFDKRNGDRFNALEKDIGVLRGEFGVLRGEFGGLRGELGALRIDFRGDLQSSKETLRAEGTSQSGT